jgi:DNA-binding Xre family transcriptional regulator
LVPWWDVHHTKLKGVISSYPHAEPAPSQNWRISARRAGIEQDLALSQLTYDLLTEAGLSQIARAQRMSTTKSVVSRLGEGGGARNRLDTLARVATALECQLVVPRRFPLT